MVWNRAAEKMFGYSKQEALGLSFFTLAIPDESTGVIRNNFVVSPTASVDPVVHKSVEITIQRKDGSRFPAGFSLFRFIVVGTIVSTCIVRDLTGQKRAEAALRETEGRYSALFNNRINGMAHCRVITDENGWPVDYVILRINEAYERIIGIRKVEIEGPRVTEVFPGIQNFAFDYKVCMAGSH